MKPILHICLVIVLSWANTNDLIAQQLTPDKPRTSFSQGNWQIGLKDGYGRGDLLSHRNIIQVSVGYYVANGLMVGLAGSTVREWSEGDIHTGNMFSVGPMVRYQFTSTRLSPFTELSYQLGRQSLAAAKGLGQSLSFTPGVSVRVRANVRVDLSYGFQYQELSLRGQLIGQPQFGINYIIR